MQTVETTSMSKTVVTRNVLHNYTSYSCSGGLENNNIRTLGKSLICRSLQAYESDLCVVGRYLVRNSL